MEAYTLEFFLLQNRLSTAHAEGSLLLIRRFVLEFKDAFDIDTY
jgi:hypothetical protein